MSIHRFRFCLFLGCLDCTSATNTTNNLFRSESIFTIIFDRVIIKITKNCSKFSRLLIKLQRNPKKTTARSNDSYIRNVIPEKTPHSKIGTRFLLEKLFADRERKLIVSETNWYINILYENCFRTRERTKKRARDTLTNG